MMIPPWAIYLINGAGMILVALAAVFYWQRKNSKAMYFSFVFGALAWFVTVALKGVWAFTTCGPVKRMLDVYAAPLSVPLDLVYKGSLTGIFECGAALPFVLLTRLRRVDWDEAVAFGIGFGAFEAFFLGALSLIPAALLIFAPAALGPDDLMQLNKVSASSILVHVFERFYALFLHVFPCVAIIYAIRSRQMRWFWISFGFKSAVDTYAGLADLWKLRDDWSMLLFDLSLSLLVIPAIIGLRVLKKKFAALAAEGSNPSNSAVGLSSNSAGS